MTPLQIQLFYAFSAIYCWLVAGIFLGFSDFIMKSLGVLPPQQGIAAMQSINILVFKSIFMVGLFALTAVSVFFVLHGILKGGSPLLILAGLIYLFTVMIVTGFANVPLNNQLAIADPSTPEAAALWQRYLKTWTNWNHIRTVGAASAATLMTVAAFQTP